MHGKSTKKSTKGLVVWFPRMMTQCRLQSILSDIASLEQSTFLPLRFLQDNIVLTHESLQWAKMSKHILFFLKLNFSKAYNKVSWRLLFYAMQKMDFSERHVSWVKLLFGNASAFIYTICIFVSFLFLVSITLVNEWNISSHLYPSKAGDLHHAWTLWG